MAQTAQPPASRAGVTFELADLTLTDGRLLVTGQWFGTRGLRFVRPALMVGERQLLATMEHKPWAPDTDPWSAAFPWDGGPVDPADVLLAVAPSVTVPLAPGATMPLRDPHDRAAAADRPGRRRSAASPAEPEPEPAPQRKPAPRPEPAAGGARLRRLEDELRLLRDDLAGLGAERDALAAERDALIAERDGLAGLDARRNAMLAERDALAAERDELRGRAEAAETRAGEHEQRAAHLQELVSRTRAAAREETTGEEDRQRERITAERERDHALAQRDEALEDRRAAVRARQRMETQRDEAVSDLQAAETVRDQALAQRDEARTQRSDALIAHRALERQITQERTGRPHDGEPRRELRPAVEHDSDDHDVPLGVRSVPAGRSAAADLHGTPPQHHDISHFDVWAIRVLGSVAAACFILLLVLLLRVFL